MDFVFGFAELGSFAYCGYTLYRWQKQHVRITEMLEFIQKAGVMSPTMLRKAMDYNGSETLLKNIKEYEEGKNYSKGVAFVQGLVESEQVIRSLLNHSTKLVLSSVSSELIFSNNKNFEEADGKTDTKYVSEFKLADASSSGEAIVLNHTSNIHFSDALHLIHSIVHMRSLSPLEKFLSWILFCIKLFLSMSNVGKKLSGFKVGTKRVERGIMVGQYMLAFGEIVFDRYNKELRMSNPLYFLKDKEQMVYKLKEKRMALNRNMTLMFTVVVIIGFLLVKRSVKGINGLIKRYKKMKELRGLDRFHRTDTLHANDFRCGVCNENVRNVILKPCLHLILCSVCFDKLQEKKCPVCRKQVEDTVTVFVV